MSVRGSFDWQESEKQDEWFQQQIKRIYFLWLCGIAVGALKLKPASISAAGVSYSIQNSDAIQGLVFIGCLLAYGAIILKLYVWRLEGPAAGNVRLVRRMLFSTIRVWGKGTLQSKTINEIRQLKKIARRRLQIWMGIISVSVYVPIVHIAIWEREPLWLGLKAIFGG
jgi:hypothetical protein